MTQKMKGNSGTPKQKRFKKGSKIGRKCLKTFIVLAKSLKVKHLEGPTCFDSWVFIRPSNQKHFISTSHKVTVANRNYSLDLGDDTGCVHHNREFRRSNFKNPDFWEKKCIHEIIWIEKKNRDSHSNILAFFVCV